MTDDLYYRKLESTSTEDLVDMIREKDVQIAELEQEKCELLGIIQDKDKVMQEWKEHFLQCSSPFCLDKFSEVKCYGELGNMAKKEGEK